MPDRTNDVRRALEGVRYPAAKSELLACARQRQAEEATLHELEELPDLTFASQTEVTMSLGGHRRG